MFATLVCWHLGDVDDEESQEKSSQANSSSSRGIASSQEFLDCDIVLNCFLQLLLQINGSSFYLVYVGT